MHDVTPAPPGPPTAALPSGNEPQLGATLQVKRNRRRDCNNVCQQCMNVVAPRFAVRYFRNVTSGVCSVSCSLRIPVLQPHVGRGRRSGQGQPRPPRSFLALLLFCHFSGSFCSSAGLFVGRSARTHPAQAVPGAGRHRRAEWGPPALAHRCLTVQRRLARPLWGDQGGSGGQAVRKERSRKSLQSGRRGVAATDLAGHKGPRGGSVNGSVPANWKSWVQQTDS